MALLPAVERAAAGLFRTTRYAALADWPLASAEIDLARDRVWVVADAEDQPIGFALVHILETSVHLNELDVHPQHARQGLGRRLIATVAEWARAQGATALTLTTFADVAWNGPYYARLGFRILDPRTLTPALQAVRRREAAAGLPMEQRVSMQLDL